MVRNGGKSALLRAIWGKCRAVRAGGRTHEGKKKLQTPKRGKGQKEGSFQFAEEAAVDS